MINIMFNINKNPGTSFQVLQSFFKINLYKTKTRAVIAAEQGIEMDKNTLICAIIVSKLIIISFTFIFVNIV